MVAGMGGSCRRLGRAQSDCDAGGDGGSESSEAMPEAESESP